jgi:FAD/FMN-containing dehydrogenase
MTEPDDSGVAITEPLPLWNGAVTHEASVVAPCRTADDVRGALERAGADGLPVSVLGGGHDWAGRAVRPGGLVIDLRPMRAAGYAAATGAIGAVGVAGLSLGGGYGPLLGVAGLALDAMPSAEVVLADGSSVTTDAEHEPR